MNGINKIPKILMNQQQFLKYQNGLINHNEGSKNLLNETLLDRRMRIASLNKNDLYKPDNKLKFFQGQRDLSPLIEQRG